MMTWCILFYKSTRQPVDMEDNGEKFQINSHRKTSVFQTGTWIAADNSHPQRPTCYKIIYSNIDLDRFFACVRLQ